MKDFKMWSSKCDEGSIKNVSDEMPLTKRARLCQQNDNGVPADDFEKVVNGLSQGHLNTHSRPGSWFDDVTLSGRPLARVIIILTR
jgi:hypothetical protein